MRPRIEESKLEEEKSETKEEKKEEIKESYDQVKVYRRLKGYVGKEIKMFSLGTTALIGSNIGQLVIPLFVG